MTNTELKSQIDLDITNKTAAGVASGLTVAEAQATKDAILTFLTSIGRNA